MSKFKDPDALPGSIKIIIAMIILLAVGIVIALALSNDATHTYRENCEYRGGQVETTQHGYILVGKVLVPRYVSECKF